MIDANRGRRAGLAWALLGLLMAVAPAAAQPATCNGLAVTIAGTTPGPISGTAGADVILGTSGDDQIAGLGGDDVICAGLGSDEVVGGLGTDLALLDEGDDLFIWSPGDGSDTIEGQGGADALRFNGSNANEIIDLSANGARLRLLRDIAAISIDAGTVEQLTISALGGADTITINSLAGTSVASVALSLAAAGGASDGQADTVTVNGTDESDRIAITGAPGSLTLSGPTASATITAPDAALDLLQVNGLAGDDAILAAPDAFLLSLPLIVANAGAAPADAPITQGGGRLAAAPPLQAGVIQLTLSGGPGADRLIGSLGDDLIIGGDGGDQVAMRDGNDTFVWSPGDDSDGVDGEIGADTLQFNGANVGEVIDLSANGARLRFFRNVANVTMDVDGVEQVIYNALGGADAITVGDLGGTAVQQVALNLAGTPGGSVGDGQADSVIINGSGGNDTIAVTGSAGNLAASGLSAGVAISTLESSDTLQVSSGDGDDTVTAQTLVSGVAALTIDGGAGDDTLTGSLGVDTLLGGAGSDLVIGQRGDDVALLGAGSDTFTWSPGDGSDLVDGQGDSDTLLFNGANVSEIIDLSANGARLRFFRNIANVTMDLDAIEQVIYNALGGADVITIGDLSGTVAQQVTIDLAASGGGGDAQADSITVNGTGGSDDITLIGSAGGVTATGLSASVSISAAEGAADTLRFALLGGADVISAQDLVAGVIRLLLDGGSEGDVLTGSQGDDTFTGGPGADHFSGGPGTDSVTDFDAGQGDTQDTIP